MSSTLLVEETLQASIDSDPRPPGARDKHEVLMCWWLERFDDETIAEFAAALGVHEASIANVAATRARLAESRNGT